MIEDDRAEAAGRQAGRAGGAGSTEPAAEVATDADPPRLPDAGGGPAVPAGRGPQVTGELGGEAGGGGPAVPAGRGPQVTEEPGGEPGEGEPGESVEAVARAGEPQEPAAAGDAGGAAPGSRTLVVDVDPWSYAVFAATALLAVVGFAIGSQASDVITGIGVGVLVGVALSPVVSAVQRRWDTTRGSAVVLVGTGLTLGIAIVVLLVAPAAIRQASDFSTELPDTVRDFYTWPIVGPRLERADAAASVEDWIQNAPARIDDRTLADAGERLLGGVLSTVVVLVTALGVMVDGETLVRRFRALVPATERARTTRMAGIVYATFGSYFAGSLFVAVLAGLVILSVGLLLGVPLAPVAGLWTALTNLIPQIGGFLGGSFFVLLALTQGPVQAVVALAVVLAYQNLENHVIQPAIVGRAVNLSPPATMMAALVGAAAAGVPGALVATPLLGAVKAIYLDSRGVISENEPEVVRRRLTRFVRRRLRRAPAPDGTPGADGGGAGDGAAER